MRLFQSLLRFSCWRSQRKPLRTHSLNQNILLEQTPFEAPTWAQKRLQNKRQASTYWQIDWLRDKESRETAPLTPPPKCAWPGLTCWDLGELWACGEEHAMPRPQPGYCNSTILSEQKNKQNTKENKRQQVREFGSRSKTIEGEIFRLPIRFQITEPDTS